VTSGHVIIDSPESPPKDMETENPMFLCPGDPSESGISLEERARRLFFRKHWWDYNYLSFAELREPRYAQLNAVDAYKKDNGLPYGSAGNNAQVKKLLSLHPGKFYIPDAVSRRRGFIDDDPLPAAVLKESQRENPQQTQVQKNSEEEDLLLTVALMESKEEHFRKTLRKSTQLEFPAVNGFVSEQPAPSGNYLKTKRSPKNQLALHSYSQLEAVHEYLEGEGVQLEPRVAADLAEFVHKSSS
jgi:hypothetical protein